jgi:hypothetical protein
MTEIACCGKGENWSCGSEGIIELILSLLYSLTRIDDQQASRAIYGAEMEDLMNLES